MSHILQFYPDGLISTLTADVGGKIVPVARNIDILGGTNMGTVGTVGTITINLNDDVTLAGFLDVGTTAVIGTTLGVGTALTVGTTANVGTALTVGTDVTLTSITDGGLLADSAGFVTASAGFTDPITGFATWTGAGAYYDASVLGDFEVLRGGTGYIKGVPITWAGGQTETGLTAGNTYYIYIDDTGTIGKTTTLSLALYQDYILLFEVLRDSTAPTNTQRTVRENHPYDFPSATSFYAHEVIGTVIENNDQGANITLNGTVKIEIVGADELADHGLYTDIPDSSGVAVSWCQMFTNGSGKWANYTTSDTFDGYWNSAGTATAPTGTKFSVYRLYVSKDDLNSSAPTYWLVLDDQEYNNLAMAQTAVANNTPVVATAELAALEFAQLGFVIYKQSTTEIIDVIIAKETLRSTISIGSGTNLASLILTNTTNFDGILSATDTTVQVALDTIDDWGADTVDHAVLIGNGTGSPIGSLAVAGNGELIIGSVGADPTVGSITSTDGSLTVTAGAGTLVIEGTDATETQDGVVELATDAEAIAGTDAVRAIVPTSLKAKLGTQTDHGLLVGSGTTGAITALAVGTNGQVPVGSTGADPVYATIGSTDGSITITGGAGTLVIEGTDATETQDGVVELATDAEAIAGSDAVRAIVPTSLKAKLGAQTDHGVLLGSGDSNAITALGVATNGQLVIGSTGADPVVASVISTDGSISVTGGAGTLDLEVGSVPGTMIWSEVTGTTQAMAVNNGYILNNGALVTATLPDTAAVGSVVRVAGKGAGGWKIAQNAGETINFGTTPTTTGAGGSLASTDDNDCVELVCITADTDWVVLSSIGNITIV